MNWRDLGPVPYDVWRDTIRKAGGPEGLSSRESWEAAGKHSALALAMLHRESSYGTAFNRNKPDNHNALNLRPPDGLGYMEYGSWAEGVEAWRERITDPTYKNGIYAKTETIEQLIQVYAPAFDSNDEGGYVRSIESDLKRWGVSDTNSDASKGDLSMAELRVILNPGHRNNTGGNAEEQAFTPKLADAYFRAFSAAGYETVNLGDTNGGLDEACRRMAAAIRDADGNCVLLDLHLEGSAAPGVFSIVPDITGLHTNAQVPQDPADTWENNVKDRSVGDEISKNIATATGLSIRTSGVRLPGLMDESQTGVGGDGFRLATFAYTSPYRKKAVRLVVEHGNHVVQPDRAIIFSPGFPEKCAAAAVKAVKTVYGSPDKPDIEYATPAPITWDEGDVGVQDLNGKPALAFKLQVEVIRKAIVPRAGEDDNRPTGKPRKKTTKLTAIGSTRDSNGNAVVILRDKSRINRNDVRPLVPLPPRAA